MAIHRKFCSAAFAIGVAVLTASHVSFATESHELVVYSYDSFAAADGVGPAIIPLFEKKCRCHVRVLPSGDAAQVLNRVEIDAKRGKPIADVIVGIDQQIWERAREFTQEWGTWKPHGYPSELVADTIVGDGFLPVDYGLFAFIQDRRAKFRTPHSLRDLMAPEFKRNVILEDPRTSTPGLAFLLYSLAVGGSEFWRDFAGQWLTFAPGWDSAYGIFLRGEAPLVWSYVTSQAYHEENGDHEHRYQAVMFDEGQPIQVEGAAMVRGTVHREWAQQFLEFLISPEAQAFFPTKNWMVPALKSAALPASFEHLPRVLKIVHPPTSAPSVARALREWELTVMSQGVHW